MGHDGELWQNMVYWRREWQTTSVFLPWEPHEQNEKAKDRTLNDELPRLIGAQYATRHHWRKNSRKNEEMESKQKQHLALDVTGDGSKVWWCKEQYCIGNWDVGSINQGKLQVVIQEMARVNTDILGISELKWTSVQFSHQVVSDSLGPHESQHARPSCPSPTPGVDPNSCPLSRWCPPTISSSVVPFFTHPQSFPASGSFQMSQLFASGGQSIGVSASKSVLPVNTQDWSPSEWTGWISLQSKGLSKVFSNTTVQKHQFFSAQLSSQSNSHIQTWPLEKP